MILFSLKPETKQNDFVILSVDCIAPLFSVFPFGLSFSIYERFALKIWHIASAPSIRRKPPYIYCHRLTKHLQIKIF